MTHLDHSHMSTLLKCLATSYKVACEFDSRPGLKFLMQKVADAQVAANLYKQAGAAWTIHTVVLIELCLNLDSSSLSMDVVKKKICDGYGKDKKIVNFKSSSVASNSVEPEELEPISQLQKHLVSFCDDYIDLVLDKDGHLFYTDSIADQPIFFLTTPIEEFPILFKTGSLSHQEKRKLSTSQTSVDSDSDVRSEGSDRKASFSAKDCSNATSSDDGKIYTVATERTIQNLMLEYKKRKQQRSMPSREHSRNKSMKGAALGSSTNSSDPVPDEIDNQRRASIMKVRSVALHSICICCESYLYFLGSWHTILF